MLVRSKFIVLFISLLLVCSCAGEKAPATPIETFKTYTKAIKQKDISAMKLLLSKDTIKMHELEAQAQGTTVDEIVKRETLFTENQKSVKLRNEKIDGDKATLEVENSFGTWETVPFVKEDGVWKIDKKGFADRMLEENEKSNKELDDLINQGRQQP
jgi:Domain of unknown function (DUF4878)